MVESEIVSNSEKITTYSKDSKLIKNRKMGLVKMIVVDDLSEATINYEAAKALNHSVNAISDDWRGYRGLTKVIDGLKQRVTPPEKAMEYLPRAHTVISNTKKMTTGVYHSVIIEYLKTI